MRIGADFVRLMVARFMWRGGVVQFGVTRVTCSYRLVLQISSGKCRKLNDTFEVLHLFTRREQVLLYFTVH